MLAACRLRGDFGGAREQLKLLEDVDSIDRPRSGSFEGMKVFGFRND